MAAADGVSVRSWRDFVATARALEDLPCLAAAAHDGDGEPRAAGARGAARRRAHGRGVGAPGRATPPRRICSGWCARSARPPKRKARERRRRRAVRTWWDDETGMLRFGGPGVPDVDGALVESVFNHMVDRMRPPKGAAVGVARRAYRRRAGRVRPQLRRRPRGRAPRPLLVVQVPLEGPAEVCGIPLPDGMVEKLRASAKVKPVLVDDHGTEIARARQRRHCRRGSASPSAS